MECEIYLARAILKHTKCGCEIATATLNQLPEKEKPMGDVGKKDKGNREEKKKAKLNPKEKRKLKIEKKKNKSQTGAIK